jgi:hypothetical protein
MNGPNTALRGPSIKHCAAARCASDMDSADGMGSRSAQGWV